MEISVGGMIGLYGGAIFGLLGWWFGRKKARENRGLDELYHHIWQKARSTSWYVTLGVIYVFFTLIMFGIDLSPAMMLGILLLAHLGSWGISGAVFAISLSGAAPVQTSRLKIGISVVVVSTIIFTILSVVTGNWKFLLFSMLPNLFGILTAFTPNRKDAE